MDGVDHQPPGGPVGLRVDLAHEPVVVEHRQGEVAPSPGVLRLVHLEHVLEVEQVLGPLTVVHQAVERREQRRAPGEGTVERLGVHPPLARGALHHRGLTRLADVRRLHGLCRGGRPGDAERPQAPRVALAVEVDTARFPEDAAARSVALPDLHDPSKVLHRPKTFIIEPTETWEIRGDVPNVIFSCANIVVGDTLRFYYAGADRVIGLATAPFADAVAFARGGA